MRVVTPPIGSLEQKVLSRRLVLAGLAAGAAASNAMAMQSLPIGRRGTPNLMVGPYYPIRRPIEEDADLTRIAGQPRRARGTIIDLAGRILGEDGVPIAGAIIDMWQANSAGRYHHPSDTSAAPVDPGFQGAALIHSDEAGRFRLRTVIPGPYENRVRHIHFDVRGRNRRLVTQMFFPGEPNETDRHYRELPTSAMKDAVVARHGDLAQADGVRLYVWDIVLAGE